MKNSDQFSLPKIKIFALIVFIFLVLAGNGLAWAQVTTLKGKTLPNDLSLQHHKEGVFSLSQYHGKVLIINFFATWCFPCRLETPDLIILYQKYKNRGLQVIGISVNDPGEKADVNFFVKNFNIPYPVGFGSEKVYKIFGDIQAVPTTFIVNRQSKVVIMIRGMAELALLEKEIKPLL